MGHGFVGLVVADMVLVIFAIWKHAAHWSVRSAGKPSLPHTYNIFYIHDDDDDQPNNDFDDDDPDDPDDENEMVNK